MLTNGMDFYKLLELLVANLCHSQIGTFPPYPCQHSHELCSSPRLIQVRRSVVFAPPARMRHITPGCQTANPKRSSVSQGSLHAFQNSCGVYRAGGHRHETARTRASARVTKGHRCQSVSRQSSKQKNRCWHRKSTGLAARWPHQV